MRLAAGRQIGELQHPLDLFFAGAVEHRRRHRHTVRQVLRKLEQIRIAQAGDVFLLAAGLVVNLPDEFAQIGRGGLRLEHSADLQSDALRRPAQMRLQHLTDVHTRRHAQRIQNDVDRSAILHVRHVLDRHDRGDDTLVAVAAGHLVAGLHAALHRQIHLDHLQHAGGEVVAGGDLGLLVIQALFERLALQLQTL